MRNRWNSFKAAAQDIHDRAGVPHSQAGTWLELAQVRPDIGLVRQAGAWRVTVTAVPDGGDWKFIVNVEKEERWTGTGSSA